MYILWLYRLLFFTYNFSILLNYIDVIFFFKKNNNNNNNNNLLFSYILHQV